MPFCHNKGRNSGGPLWSRMSAAPPGSGRPEAGAMPGDGIPSPDPQDAYPPPAGTLVVCGLRLPHLCSWVRPQPFVSGPVTGPLRSGHGSSLTAGPHVWPAPPL